MDTYKQVLLLCVLVTLAAAAASPDGGETHPVPGPGLAYGGIPYGSMSGNVAEFFKRQAAAPSSGVHSNYVDYAPIEQYLR